MVIIIQCEDRVGLVADITSVLAKAGCNIISMREHVDIEENKFFVRIEVNGISDPQDIEMTMTKVLPVNATVRVNPIPDKNIVVLVTKEYHCLSDILTRNHFRTLGANVRCVIGNHPDLQNITERFSIPFYFVSHENKTREKFEDELMKIILPFSPDFLILAKFMRIMSPEFIDSFRMKIINIHHSFKLPDLIKAGRENETAALVKAMQLVFEDRVFVYNNKTVVFE